MLCTMLCASRRPSIYNLVCTVIKTNKGFLSVSYPTGPPTHTLLNNNKNNYNN